jgi:hypothetical protein
MIIGSIFTIPLTEPIYIIQIKDFDLNTWAANGNVVQVKMWLRAGCNRTPTFDNLRQPGKDVGIDLAEPFFPFF